MPHPTRPADPRPPQSEPHHPGARRPWVHPVLEALPPLTRLTLQSGGPIPGDGDTGNGGSTVFS